MTKPVQLLIFSAIAMTGAMSAASIAEDLSTRLSRLYSESDAVVIAGDEREVSTRNIDVFWAYKLPRATKTIAIRGWRRPETWPEHVTSLLFLNATSTGDFVLHPESTGAVPVRFDPDMKTTAVVVDFPAALGGPRKTTFGDLAGLFSEIAFADAGFPLALRPFLFNRVDVYPTILVSDRAYIVQLEIRALVPVVCDTSTFGVTLKRMDGSGFGYCDQRGVRVTPNVPLSADKAATQRFHFRPKLPLARYQALQLQFGGITCQRCLPWAGALSGTRGPLGNMEMEPLESCPACGVSPVVPITYGLVNLTTEGHHALERGEFILGGCTMRTEKWHCHACQQRWRNEQIRDHHRKLRALIAGARSWVDSSPRSE